RASREQADAAVTPRERLDDQAGFLVGISVQHIPRFEFSPALHGLAVTQLLEEARVAGPVLLHLDPDAEIDLAVEQAFHVLARGAGDALELLALGADDDRLLAVALHPDGHFDAPEG